MEKSDKNGDDSIPTSSKGNFSSNPSTYNVHTDPPGSMFLPLSVPFSQQKMPQTFVPVAHTSSQCSLSQTAPYQSVQSISSGSPTVSHIFNPLFFQNLYPNSFPSHQAPPNNFNSNLYMTLDSKGFSSMGPTSVQDPSSAQSRLISPSSYLMDMYRMAGNFSMIPPMHYSFPNPLSYVNFGGIGTYGVALPHMPKDALGNKSAMAQAAFPVGTCNPPFNSFSPCVSTSGFEPLPSLSHSTNAATLPNSVQRGLKSKSALAHPGSGVEQGCCEARHLSGDQMELKVSETSYPQSSEEQRVTSVPSLPSPSLLAATSSGPDYQVEAPTKKKGSRFSAIFTSKTDVLLEGERQEWMTPVTLEYIMFDVDALLHLRKTDTDPNKISSASQRVENAKNLFTRFSTTILAQHSDASQYCAVCWEGARPRNLAYLGDILVFCKDCNLTVHRRCYGVHVTFVKSNENEKTYFLCEFCAYRRSLNQLKTEKKEVDECLVKCVICYQEYDGNKDPQAFRPITGRDGRWVHVYCALLSKELVEINDLRTMSLIVLLDSPALSDSTSAPDDKNQSASDMVSEVEEDHPSYERLASKTEKTDIAHLSQICIFCGKAAGSLLKCSDAMCSSYMHLWCLRRQVFLQEQEERNSLSGALNVTLDTSSTSGGSCQIKVFCLNHVSAPYYCVCRKPFLASEQSVMVGCDVCGDWLHASCIGSLEVNLAMQSEYYQCVRCQKQRVYLRFLNELWGCYPFEHEDVMASRELLVKLYSMTNSELVVPELCFFENILPSHTTPLPFVDIVLFCFFWQWRAEILLLADRVVFPCLKLSSKTEVDSSVLLDNQYKENCQDGSLKAVKKLQLKRKDSLALSKAGSNIDELNSNAKRGLDREVKLSKGYLKCRTSEHRPRILTKKGSTCFFLEDTLKKAQPSLREKKKKKILDAPKRISIMGQNPLKSGDISVLNHGMLKGGTSGKPYSSLSEALQSNPREIGLRAPKFQATSDFKVENGLVYEFLRLLDPVSSLIQVHHLLSLADCFPVAMGNWVGDLRACLLRCEAWVNELDICLRTENFEEMAKCLKCFEEESIVEFLTTLKQQKTAKKSCGGVSKQHRFLALGSPSYIMRTYKEHTSCKYVIGALSFLTKEAIQLRQKGVVQGFIKEVTPFIFGTPASSLCATRIKKVISDIHKIPELRELKGDKLYSTALHYMDLIRECQNKARELSEQSQVSLEDIRSLLYQIEENLPKEHQIELYNLPELLQKGTELEKMVDRKNLRSIRETLAQAQQLPIRSAFLTQLQELVFKIDAWRKEYQRFVSLVKAARLSQTGTGTNSSDSECRNVVVSGRSGFLKDLFFTSDHPGGMSSDKAGGGRPELEPSTVFYIQSKTLEDALKLLRRKSEFDVECDEVFQLQDWIHQCQTWLSIVERLLGRDYRNSPRDCVEICNTYGEISKLQEILNKKLQLSEARTPEDNYWDILTMEELLRNKLELPLAVSPDLVASLEERVQQLQDKERRILRVAQGFLTFTDSTTNSSMLLEKSSVHQLIQDARQLLQSMSYSALCTRAEKLEKCCQVLTKHLTVYESWESLVNLTLSVTNNFFKIEQENGKNYCMEMLSQLGEFFQHHSLSYPPNTKLLPHFLEPVVDLSNLCVIFQNHYETTQQKSEMCETVLRLVNLKSPLGETAEVSSSPIAMSEAVYMESCSSPNEVDVNLFEDELTLNLGTKSGVDQILKEWDVLQKAVESEENDDFKAFRQQLVKWVTLVLVHFLILGNSVQLRQQPLYCYFQRFVAAFLNTLNINTETLYSILIPSCHLFMNPMLLPQESYCVLSEDMEKGCRDKPLFWNFFLIAFDIEVLQQCLRRLLCFWFLTFSDLLVTSIFRPSTVLLKDMLTIHETVCQKRNVHFKRPLWLSEAALSKAEHSLESLSFKPDARVSCWHLYMLELLKECSACKSTGKDFSWSSSSLVEQDAEHISCQEKPFVLELQLLKLLRHLTWNYRAQHVLELLESCEALMTFTPSSCFYQVKELLNEHEQMTRFGEEMELAHRLNFFLSKFNEWNETLEKYLTRLGPCHIAIPQLFYPNPTFLHNGIMMQIVLGVSGSSADNKVKCTSCLFNTEEFSSESNKVWLHTFLNSEWSFRERWLQESTHVYLLRLVNASDFESFFQVLQQSILCLGALQSLAPSEVSSNPPDGILINKLSFSKMDVSSTDQITFLLQKGFLKSQSTLGRAFSTGDSKNDTLSSLEAPLFYGEVKELVRTSLHQCGTLSGHAPWCDSTGKDFFSCCWPPQIFHLRDLYTVFFQGYATLVPGSISFMEYGERVNCLNGLDSLKKSMQHRDSFMWFDSKDNVYLHRQSIETYRFIQNCTAFLFFQHIREAFREVQKILVERPVLCSLEHPFLQLLTLRKDILEWSASVLYVILDCMGLELGYLKEDHALHLDVRLETLCCFERFLFLVDQRHQLCRRLETAAVELASIDTVLAQRILSSFGAQWISQHELDTTQFGGFLYYDICQRLHCLNERVQLILRSCRQGTCLEFLHALYMCHSNVASCFNWDFKQSRMVRPISLCTLPIPATCHLEHEREKTTWNDYCGVVVETFTTLREHWLAHEKVEEFILSFFLLLLFWCVRHNTNFQEDSPQLVAFRRFLLTLPPHFVQLLQSTQDVFETVQLLPFLHITHDLGVIVLAFRGLHYEETSGEHPTASFHLVYLLSEVLVWLPFALDLIYLKTTPLSLLLPQQSKGYLYFTNLISRGSQKPFNEEMPFFTQTLEVLSDWFSQPTYSCHLSEALRLPLDILKWRSQAVLYLLPHTVSYDTLKDLLKKKQAFDLRLKQLDVYFSHYFSLQNSYTLPCALRHTILNRLFPSFKTLHLPKDLFVNPATALAWICTSSPVTCRDTTQLSPFSWSKHGLPEYEELSRRHEIATLTVNEFQLHLNALRNPLKAALHNTNDLPHCCGLANPHVVTPLLTGIRRQRVCHGAFETVLMYLEDLYAWEGTVYRVLYSLQHQVDQQTILASLPPQPSVNQLHETCPFNRWGVFNVSQLNEYLQTLWEAYGITKSSIQHPQATQAISAELSQHLSLELLQSLLRKSQELHWSVENIPAVGSFNLHQIVDSLTAMESRGQQILEQARLIARQSTLADETFFSLSEKQKTDLEVDCSHKSSTSPLLIEDIEQFLQQSYLTQIPCHAEVKDLLRRYVEMECLATYAFCQRQTTLYVHLPRPTEYKPFETETVIHESTILNQQLQHEIYQGSHVSCNQLVYFVFLRSQTLYCPSYGNTRHRILQQCWIAAFRCVMKGFYGSLSETEFQARSCSIPLKVLQALYLASRCLFASTEMLPLELNHLKVLLAAAKRFLLEARANLDAWIRLRMMVQCYPIYFGEEMKLIQDKLQKKFSNIFIDVVIEKDQLKEIQLYKDKQLKTRYIPPKPFDIKPCLQFEKPERKLEIITRILKEASQYSDPSILEECYAVSLEKDQVQLLLEKPLREATQQCLNQLFSESSLADSIDREKLLYDTAESCVNETYFQSLQEMTLKRLQKTITIHRMAKQPFFMQTSEISSNAAPSTVPAVLKRNQSSLSDLRQTTTSLPSAKEQDSLSLLLMSRPKSTRKKDDSEISQSLHTIHQDLDSALNPPVDLWKTETASDSTCHQFMESTLHSPNRLVLTPLEQAGFLWNGSLHINNRFFNKATEPDIQGIAMKNTAAFLYVWLVPLFSPMPKSLLLTLRQYNSMYLQSTMSLEEYALYINPLYPNSLQNPVQLLNVVVTADWSLAENSDDSTQQAMEFVQNKLRPKQLTVLVDVPKAQLPIERLESLERNALQESLKVLCFCVAENQESSLTNMRLWVVPPEPLVTESFLSSDFPKSSQLVFGALEVPTSLFHDVVPENASLSMIRKYAASVTQSLKNLNRTDSSDVVLPPFTNLRVTFLPTTIEWVTRHEVSQSTNETALIPSSGEKEQHTERDDAPTIKSPIATDPLPFVQRDVIPHAEALIIGPRIPKRPKQNLFEQNVPLKSRSFIQEKFQTTDFGTPQQVAPDAPKRVNQNPWLSPKLPCSSPGMYQPRYRPIRNNFKPSQSADKSFPPWQRHTPCRPWAQPFVIQPPPNLAVRHQQQTVPHTSLPPADPYQEGVRALPRPTTLDQSIREFPSFKQTAPWREQDPDNYTTSNMPPWKQQKISPEPIMPFKVPQALKSLIQNAAAELRFKRHQEESSNEFRPER